jgi:putative membrane protein
MGAVLQSFVSGFPVLMLHLATTTGMLAIAVAIYTALTPHHEFRLIREGNLAAALSLSGAILGMSIPLAFCMAASVSVYDILVWGTVTLLLQLVAYKAVDLLLHDLSRRIEAGEMAPAIVLVAVKVAMAAINAAAVAG